MKSELHLLTVLLGGAVIWALLHHAFTSLINVVSLKSSSIPIIIHRGWLGGDLFFILSGFIMAFTYLEESTSFNYNNAKVFWIKRFARMYPAFLFVTLFFAIVVIFTSYFGFFMIFMGNIR